MRRYIALALATAVSVGACTPPVGSPSTQPRDTPQPGGRLVLLTTNDLSYGSLARPAAAGLQPALNANIVTDNVLRLVYRGLVQPDATGELRPDLATWTVSPDGLEYSWTIEPKAVWSDGHPVVAEDYLTYLRAVARTKVRGGQVGALRRIVGFGEYEAGRASGISGVATDGNKLLKVRLEAAYCQALLEIFQRQPIPTHVFGKYLDDSDVSRNLDDAPENIAPSVTDGPFLFVEWRKGDQLTLKRNPNYWKGAPYLDALDVRVVSSLDAVLSELKAGRTHMSEVGYPGVAELEALPHLKTLSYTANAYTFIGWNLRADAGNGLSDKRIRQALAYGLDMNAVIREILGGRATRMTAYHPPGSWAFTPGLNEYHFDPARAEELIRSAGYTKGADGYYQKDGRSLTLNAVTNRGNRVRESLLQLATDQYRAIGIRIVPRLEAFQSMTSDLNAGTLAFDAVVIGWDLIDSGEDPFAVLHSRSIPDPATKKLGLNFVGYADAAVDAAIDRGRAGPDCSIAGRKAAYADLNRILNQDQPYNFGFSPNGHVVIPNNLQGVDTGPFVKFHNVETWWFKR